MTNAERKEKLEDLKITLTAIGDLKQQIGTDLDSPKLKGLLKLLDSLTTNANEYAEALKEAA